MTSKNYNFGIIGNCNYLALVDEEARIVWMCWPRFDDSFVFGRLLDKEKGGEFSIIPQCDVKLSRQAYVENTNVLETVVHCADSSSYRVTDFAPRFERQGRYNKPLMVVRKVEPLEGVPKIKVLCHPKGDYGKQDANVHFGSNHIHYSGIGEPIRLTTNIPLTYISKEKFFVLDDTKYLILTWGRPFEGNIEEVAEDFLYKTIAYWQKWASQCAISRYYQKEVLRSALALKLHQYEDTGAIIASATTSLPESQGAGRNWDYRYCWLRDSYYTISALNRMSRFDEMKKFSQYLQNIAEVESGGYAPVYTLSGDLVPPEIQLDLAGFRGNRPVRIGNLASIQLQNDIYGQVLLALLPFYVDERFPGSVKATSRDLVNKILGYIEKTQGVPDATLWEYRGELERHCYTDLFHWAGAKAAVKIAEKLNDRELHKRALKVMALSRKYIESCYDVQSQAYMPSQENSYADASLLHLITLGFITPDSDRAKKHLEFLEKKLVTPEGNMLRYDRPDDFGKPEVSFSVCSFWHVEALANVGKIDEAFRVFEKMLSYSNHLGLFSEDVDEQNNCLWGNFPQTYTHVGLINAAFKLSRSFDYPDFF